MIAIGDKAANRWHLQIAKRWVVQYNFYINDRNWGRGLWERRRLELPHLLGPGQTDFTSASQKPALEDGS
jgi:hypothetical protein